MMVYAGNMSVSPVLALLNHFHYIFGNYEFVVATRDEGEWYALVGRGGGMVRSRRICNKPHILQLSCRPLAPASLAVA
jgi:hypothetical protein